MDWLDLLAVQGTLRSLLQHHSSKASILRRSAFFTVQLSHLYMTTGKTIALTRWTFVGKVMSLLLNMLSRLVITFLPRSKHLLISWLQSPSHTYEPSSCVFKDMNMCSHIQSHKLIHVSGIHCHVHTSSASGCASVYFTVQYNSTVSLFPAQDAPKWKWKWSRSVVSDSLRPRGL